MSVEPKIPDILKNLVGSYTAVAVLTVYVYNIILTLVDEVEFIWRERKPTLRTAVYSLSRYFLLPYLIWAAVTKPSGKTIMNEAYYVTYGLAIISRAAIELALTVRVYAITGGNRAAAIILGGLAALSIVASIVAEVTSEYQAMKLPEIFFTAFEALQILPRVLFDTIATILIIYEPVHDFASSPFASKGIYRLIFDHGVTYFMIITTLDATNVVLVLLSFYTNKVNIPQAGISQVALPLSSILVCQFILDLRHIHGNFNDASLPAFSHLSFGRPSENSISRQFGDPVFTPKSFSFEGSGSKDGKKRLSMQGIELTRSGARDALATQRFLHLTRTMEV